MPDLNTIFSADGLLAGNIPDYRPRTQQLEMVQAITQTIENQEILVTEAGTGTGKTYAYLVPALLSGGKVISSGGFPGVGAVTPPRRRRDWGALAVLSV